MSGRTASWSARFPEGWWGYHWEPPTPMSAVELIGTPAIDARLMATLWAVVERRRGVMLSSEAPQAGKTTLLSALVDFLPADTTGIFVRGWWEEYDWLDEIPAGTGFLLINEMSDHLPIYVWGRAARGALMLAGKGWGIGATMHADSLPEALDGTSNPPGRDRCGPRRPDHLPPVLGLPDARRDVSARRGGVAPAPRRDRDAGAGPARRDRGRSVPIAHRRPAPAHAADAGLGRRPLDPPIRPRRRPPTRCWPRSLGLDADAFEAELARREAFLEDLASRGVCDAPAVADAVRDFGG